MPKELRKLGTRYKGRTLVATLVGLALVLLAVLMVAGAFSTPEEALPYDAAAAYGDGTYLSITPDYASKAIWTQKGQSYFILFWWDEAGDLQARLVRGSSKLDKALTDLQYYTYGVQSEAPDKAITVRGCTAPLPDGVRDAAVAEYNRLVQDGDASADRFEEFFGTQCLDVSKVPAHTDVLAAGAVIGVLALAWIVLEQARRAPVRRQNARTLAALGAADLIAAEREMPGARRWPVCGMALSENYVYASGTGAVVVPLRQVRGADIERRGRRAALVLQLTDGTTRTLAPLRDTEMLEGEYDEISSALYGAAERAAFAAPAPAGAASGTAPAYAAAPAGAASVTAPAYAAAPAGAASVTAPAYTAPAGPLLDLQLDPPASGNGTAQVPNTVRGLFGALAGCLLGGALWVAIGAYANLISGWVGALTILLALKLYRKAAGGLDKTGAVVSIALSVFTVLPASFFMYVVSLLSKNPGTSFSYACSTVWQALPTTPEVWLDVLLGIALTLLVGVPTAQSVLHPGQAPRGYSAGPAPVPDGQGRTELHAPSSAKSGGLALYILGAVCGVIALIGCVVCFSSEDAGSSFFIFLPMLLLCVLFLALGAVLNRQARYRRIVYDARGLNWFAGPNRSFSCPWEQVKELRLGNAYRMKIITPQGTLMFNYTWAGWQQLRQAAEQYAVNAVRR